MTVEFMNKKANIVLFARYFYFIFLSKGFRTNNVFEDRIEQNKKENKFW